MLALSAASYPPLQTAQGRGTHLCGGLGQIKARATRPPLCCFDIPICPICVRIINV